MRCSRELSGRPVLSSLFCSKEGRSPLPQVQAGQSSLHDLPPWLPRLTYMPSECSPAQAAKARRHRGARPPCREWLLPWVHLVAAGCPLPGRGPARRDLHGGPWQDLAALWFCPFYTRVHSDPCSFRLTRCRRHTCRPRPRCLCGRKQGWCCAAFTSFTFIFLNSPCPLGC